MKILVAVTACGIAAICLPQTGTAQATISSHATPATVNSPPSDTITPSSQRSIEVDGPWVIRTNTWSGTIEGFVKPVVFTIRKPWPEGYQFQVCRSIPEWLSSEESGCEKWTAGPALYPNGQWRMRRAGEGWQVRLYTPEIAMNEALCIKQYERSWNGNRVWFSVRDRGRDAEFTVQYQCEGFAVGTRGKASEVIARIGRPSKKLWIKVDLIDRYHEATVLRVCGPEGCKPYSLTNSNRTEAGWEGRVPIQWNPVTKATCRKLRRNYPGFTYEFQLLSRDQFILANAARMIRVDCSP